MRGWSHRPGLPRGCGDTSIVLPLRTMVYILALLCISGFNLINLSSCLVSANLSQIDEFLNLLKSRNYDHRIPPPLPPDGGPIMVDLALWINAIADIDEKEMDYTVNAYFEQIWQDRRLDFTNELQNASSITLPHTLQEAVWVPDAFFENGKEEIRHDVTVPNFYTRIYPNGTVRYDQRLTLRIWCSLKLQYFPLDTQHCDMKIMSYRYTTEEIYYRWRAVNPVEMGRDLRLARYNITNVETHYCDVTFSTGSYSCVTVNFWFERLIGYYLLQIYVPSILVVVLSWMSFWLDPLAVPGRVSLGVLTVLTIATQAAQVAEDLPKVSYVKAIDVWMTTCMCFLVLALLEFALVNSLARQEISLARKKTLSREGHNGGERVRGANGVYDTTKLDNAFVDEDNIIYHTSQILQSQASAETPKPQSKNGIKPFKITFFSYQVDSVSRIMFPLSFLIFNAVYWTVYELHQKEAIKVFDMR